MALEPLDPHLTEHNDAALERKQKPLRYVVLDPTNHGLTVRLPPGNSLLPHEATEVADELHYAVAVLAQLNTRAAYPATPEHRY